MRKKAKDRTEMKGMRDEYDVILGAASRDAVTRPRHSTCHRPCAEQRL